VAVEFVNVTIALALVATGWAFTVELLELHEVHEVPTLRLRRGGHHR
jgi:hypothetical protein